MGSSSADDDGKNGENDSEKEASWENNGLELKRMLKASNAALDDDDDDKTLPIDESMAPVAAVAAASAVTIEWAPGLLERDNDTSAGWPIVAGAIGASSSLSSSETEPISDVKRKGGASAPVQTLTAEVVNNTADAYTHARTHKPITFRIGAKASRARNAGLLLMKNVLRSRLRGALSNEELEPAPAAAASTSLPAG
jgi:hypothetical protein